MNIAGPDGSRRVASIASMRKRKGAAIIGFDGVSSRDEAEQLRGSFLEVPLERVPPAPEGSYYFFQLVGCRCLDGQGELLGTIVELVDDGGGLLLEIESEHGTLLVPFVSTYLRRVDVEGGEIELDLPEGLVETCTSTS